MWLSSRNLTDMKQPIVIATTSWARNKQEGETILKTLTELNKLGLPIVLTDERSKFSKLNRIRKLKNLKVFKGNGLDSRIKRSFFEASRIGRFIFYLESDKIDFAKNHARVFVQEFLKSKEGIMLAVRSKKSFHKYPKYQKAMEKFLWESYGSLFGSKTTDISYGPRIFPEYLVRYMEHIEGKIGFGWQSYLMTISLRLELPLKEIVFSIDPPPDIQKGQEVVLHRIWQAKDYLNGFIQGLRINL